MTSDIHHAMFSNTIQLGGRISKPELCFVVRTMPTHKYTLPALLFSIFSSLSSLEHVRAVLVASNLDDSEMLNSVATFVNNFLGPSAPVSVSMTNGIRESSRFPMIRNASSLSAGSAFYGDAGYIVTDVVLEQLLQEKMLPLSTTRSCDFVVVTNGDNIYASSFVPAITSAMLDGFDLIATHFLTRYNHNKGSFLYHRGSGSGPVRVGSDVEFVPAFQASRADLGAVAFRLDMLDKLSLRFLIDRLRKDPSGFGIEFALADGLFFENFSKAAGVRSKILRGVHFVHQ